MSEFEPLFVRYLDETIQVDPNGCKDIADLIVKTKKEFAPELDSFSLCKLTLHRYDGDKLRSGLKISELLEQSGFENDGDSPLLIRYADALPVVKKPKTVHPSEERRKRWEELNSVIIQAEIDADENSDQTDLKGCFEYSSLNWSHIYKTFGLGLA